MFSQPCLLQDDFTLVCRSPTPRRASSPGLGVPSLGAPGPAPRGPGAPSPGTPGPAPSRYDVLRCAAPCATGRFSVAAVADATGTVLHGELPPVQGRFTGFQGRHLLYSNAKVGVTCVWER